MTGGSETGTLPQPVTSRQPSGGRPLGRPHEIYAGSPEAPERVNHTLGELHWANDTARSSMDDKYDDARALSRDHIVSREANSQRGSHKDATQADLWVTRVQNSLESLLIIAALLLAAEAPFLIETLKLLRPDLTSNTYSVSSDVSNRDREAITPEPTMIQAGFLLSISFGLTITVTLAAIVGLQVVRRRIRHIATAQTSSMRDSTLSSTSISKKFDEAIADREPFHLVLLAAVCLFSVGFYRYSAIFDKSIGEVMLGFACFNGFICFGGVLNAFVDIWKHLNALQNRLTRG